MGNTPSEEHGKDCHICGKHLNGVGPTWDHVHRSGSLYTFTPPGGERYYRREGQDNCYKCQRCYDDPNWKQRQEQQKRQEAERKRQEAEKKRKAEAEKKCQEEAERKRQEEAERKRQEEAEKREEARRRQQQNAREAVNRATQSVSRFITEGREKRTKEKLSKKSQQVTTVIKPADLYPPGDPDDEQEVPGLHIDIEDILCATPSKDVVFKLLNIFYDYPEKFKKLTSEQAIYFKSTLGELLNDWSVDAAQAPSVEVFWWVHVYLMEVYLSTNDPSLDDSQKEQVLDLLTSLFTSVQGIKELVQFTQSLYSVAVTEHGLGKGITDCIEKNVATCFIQSLLSEVFSGPEKVSQTRWSKVACMALSNILVHPISGEECDYSSVIKKVINSGIWNPTEVVHFLFLLHEVEIPDTYILATALEEIVMNKIDFGLFGNKSSVVDVLRTSGPQGLLHRVRKCKDLDIEKDVEAVCSEILDNKLASIESVEKVKRIVTSMKQILRKSGYPYKLSHTLTAGEVRNSLRCLGDLSEVFEDVNNLSKLLSLMSCIVNQIEGYWPRATQMVSCILLLISGKNHGRLIEIATGEGKSCIIALAAAALALSGKYIDIITSSPILAKRDAEKWSRFYSFLSLEASHNTGLDSDTLRKKCYKAEIVYGTVSSFASDILRQEFHMKDIRSSRSKDDSAVIVDEVDFMLLDRGVQFTYLSHKSLGFRHLDPVFAMIWNGVSRFEPIMIEGQKYLCDRPQPFYKALESILDSDADFDISDVLEVAEKKKLLGTGFADEVQKGDVKQSLAGITSETMAEFFKLPDFKEGLELYAMQKEESEWKVVKVCSSAVDIPGDASEDSQEDCKSVLLLDDGLCMVLVNTEESLQAGIGDKIKQLTSRKTGSDGIRIPKHLNEFVEDRIPTWVKSAFQAIQMTEGREYLVRDGRVLPIDFKSTGVVETNKKWGDGLQQFVELKHDLEMSQVSLVTNFMSNLAFFKRYGSNLYGVSGTLGSETDQTFLKGEFDVDFCKMPTHKVRKLYEDEGRVLQDEAKWLAEISEEVKSEIQAKAWGKSGRAALIICEDMITADKISGTLKGEVQGTMHVYTGRVGEELPSYPLPSGDVVVATNLAGRGTDIKVTNEVNKAGGLFVLVTFLPSNTRIQEQAFGRTGRKGLPGSAKIFLNAKRLPTIYKENLSSVEALQIARTKLEKDRVQIMVNTEVKECVVKENLFSTYCTHLKSAVKEFSDIGGEEEQKLAVTFLHEKWGLWLQMKSEKMLKEPKEELVASLNSMATKAIGTIDRKESQNIYHIIRFANEHLANGDVGKASEMYQKALEADAEWTSIALYNRAYCKIKMAKDGYMKSAEQDLKQSLENLNNYKEELQQVFACVTTPQQNRKGKADTIDKTDLQKNIETRQRIISSFQNNIEKAIEQLETLHGNDEKAVAETASPMDLAQPNDRGEQAEIAEMWEHGLLYIYSVKKKPEFCWSALLCLFIGLAQVAAGIFLTAISGGALAAIGKSLVESGVSDIITGVEGMAKGAFDWASWGIGKAISIATTILTMGIGALLSKGKQIVSRIISKGKDMFQQGLGKTAKGVTEGAKKALEQSKFAARNALGQAKNTANVATSAARRNIGTVAFTSALSSACKAAGTELAKQVIVTAAEYGEEKALDALMKQVEDEVVRSVNDKVMKSAASGQISAATDRLIKIIMRGNEAGIDQEMQNDIRGIVKSIGSEVTQEYTQRPQWREQTEKLFEGVTKKLGKTKYKGNKMFGMFMVAVKAATIAADTAIAISETVEVISNFESQVSQRLNEFCAGEEAEAGLAATSDSTEEASTEAEVDSDSVTELKSGIGKDLAEDLGAAITGIWRKDFLQHISSEINGKFNEFLSDNVEAKWGKPTSAELAAAVHAMNPLQRKNAMLPEPEYVRQNASSFSDYKLQQQNTARLTIRRAATDLGKLKPQPPARSDTI